jgi:TadE-like protein
MPHRQVQECILSQSKKNRAAVKGPLLVADYTKVKLGRNAAGYLPILQSTLAKRFRRQDGAVAVEMVLVSMLLVPLVCGLLDFGMLWQKNQTAESAMRQAARRVAGSCVVPLNDTATNCKSGNKADDDTKALLATLSALGSAASEIETVVVFNANNSSTHDLNGSAPAGCLSAIPPNGIVDECNVYGPDEIAGIATLTPAALTAKFSCISHLPSPSLPSSYWCPLDRARSSNAPTYVGVAIKLRHRHITGLFGSSAPVKAQAIFRLEPNTLAPAEVHANDMDVLVAESSTIAEPSSTVPPPPTITSTTLQTVWPCWSGANYTSLAEYTLLCIPEVTSTTTTTTTIQTSWPCWNGISYGSLAQYDLLCLPEVTSTTTTTTTIQTDWWCWNGNLYHSQPAYNVGCVPPTSTIAPTTTTRLRTGGGNL